jgi:hypothetical protein
MDCLYQHDTTQRLGPCISAHEVVVIYDNPSGRDRWEKMEPDIALTELCVCCQIVACRVMLYTYFAASSWFVQIDMIYRNLHQINTVIVIAIRSSMKLCFFCCAVDVVAIL